MAVSEMISSDSRLWDSDTTCRRRRTGDRHRLAGWLRGIQIAGAHPTQMAEAARRSAGEGAEIIDINMGCPAKKICRVAAGSALLRDEPLVGRILDAVVNAVDVPVTLKIRTGWCPETRNAVPIARMAEASGIAAVAVHGRTRACAFRGHAEYDTIREVKEAVSIPVIANGDIANAEQAEAVLSRTGADAVMIGRAAQGNPWIFREIDNCIRHRVSPTPPSPAEVKEVLIEHLAELHHLYGPVQGVRVARKHLSWYCRNRPGGQTYWCRIRTVEDPSKQIALTTAYLDRLIDDPATSTLNAEAA